MQPFGAVERIKESYQRFVETSFPLADESVKREFRKLIEEKHLLWQEPYVSLSRLFRTDYTLEDAVQQGLLSPTILNTGSPSSPKWLFTHLFNHQYEAIQRLTTCHGHRPRNTLIATGTGSGKTEAFLIPIIDHCLRNPGPGIQAVIVYPMNALANDQLGRMCKVLEGAGVTFGRYTGDTKENPKDLERKPIAEERATRREIQQNPPQILLTNYSMLEYLLVRKRDRFIFKKTTPRFLVLDEVHTYVGVLGAEVACLIRRFKEHAGLAQNELCCVGTSATLIAPTAENALAGENPTRELITFATMLFGEEFEDDEQSLIQEVYRPIPEVREPVALWKTPDVNETFFRDFDDENEKHVRTLAAAFGIYLRQGTSGEAFFTDLYQQLEHHPVFLSFARLLQEPRPLTDLVAWLREHPRRAGVGDEQLKREAAAILLLGSVAKRYNSETREPEALYRPKVHLCMRSLTPLTMALQASDGGPKLLSEGETEYREEPGNAAHNGHNGHQDDKPMPAALPLTVCRSCGTHYLKGYYVQNEEEIAASQSGRSNGRAKSGRTVGRKAGGQKASKLPETLIISANQPYNSTFQELYVLLQPMDEGQSTEIDEDGNVAEGEDLELGKGLSEGRYYLVCPFCLIAHAEETVPEDTLFVHMDDCAGKQSKLLRFFGFGKASKCPKCNAQGHGMRDVITPMRGGAAVSVSILTESLLPQLKGGTDESGVPDGSIGEKKLLIFSDSRQDTAHQAGYMRDSHQTFAQRQLTCGAVANYEQAEDKGAGEGVPLSQLAQEVYNYCKNTWKSEADALNLLTINTTRASGLDSGLKRPSEHISNPEREFAKARLNWDLHIEFTQRANTRNSLEREGLIGIEYSGLEESAREGIGRFAACGLDRREEDVRFLATLLRVIMDYMRRQRAVDYKYFADYLSHGSDGFTSGHARPNKYTRTPQGFDSEKHEARGAYNIFSWHSTKSGRGATAIYDAVARMFVDPNAPKEQQAQQAKLAHDCIELAVPLLIEKGYIRKVRIGQLTGGSGQHTREAYQLAGKFLQATTQGPRFCCDTCNDVRSYQVATWKTHGSARPASICANYHCKGKTTPYTVHSDNFYVYFYQKSKAERLYAVEHSGQLSGDERIQIEEGFREGRINVIVCTQTLELGVDIGDLPAIILRNIPPTPSNYAQRSGRPGRKLRIALILTHAGQGPHDTYFFHHLNKVIVGAIRPPVFLIDNEVVIRRHINSLILEKLKAELPRRWQKPPDGWHRYEDEEEEGEDGETAGPKAPENIVDEDGAIRPEWLDGLITVLRSEVEQRHDEIRTAVKQAFVREYSVERQRLSWLNDDYVTRRCADFVPDLRAGLEHWCDRYREIYSELVRITRKVLLSPTEKRRRDILDKALRTLLDNQEYRPLSYLAKVGFLPSYGFPGTTVTVRDDDEHQIAQVASVGVTEYALGNVVYVRGRKLQINRVHFKGGKTEPLKHAIPYKYCETCSYVTDQATAQECPYCQRMLVQGQHIEYETVHGWNNENITQEDEYRTPQDYKVSRYLDPLPVDADTTVETHKPNERKIGRWLVRYSHLRNITILNKGKLDPKTGRIIPFKVCLECGAWIRPTTLNEEEAERNGFRASGTDHLYSCSVRADRGLGSSYEQDVDLKVQLQGDAVEIELPGELSISMKPEDLEKRLTTLQEALKLGLQLELFTKPGEIDSFVATRMQGGREQKTLVLYDTMPGGTGYLRRFYDYLPQIAQKVYQHLFHDDPCETACYSCLKEFWNQRLHGLLDKRLVRGVLEELAGVIEGAGIL